MNRDEIDVLWNRALSDAVAAGEIYTRYRFAELVAAAERKDCVRVCKSVEEEWAASRRHSGSMAAADCAASIRAKALLSRGQA